MVNKANVRYEGITLGEVNTQLGIWISHRWKIHRYEKYNS